MTVATRRSMLQGVLGLGLVYAFPAGFGSGESNSTWMGKDVLESVYEAWCSASEVAPPAFLKATGCLDLDESSLKARIRNDFLAGRIATYDGLVISKTEFALWAWFGQGA